jgi:hypothetical protein
MPLGPDRKLREPDIVVRPYPMRSSAEPKILFFDVETKQCAIVLHGRMVKAKAVLDAARRWMVPPFSPFRASSIRPSFC